MSTEEKCCIVEASRENDSSRGQWLAGKDMLTGFRNKEVVDHRWEARFRDKVRAKARLQGS